MVQFTVSPDGLLVDTAVRQAATRAADLWPGLDRSALEANMTVVRAYRAINRVGEAALAQFGLTSSRASVIAMLYRAEGRRLTISEIAAGQSVTTTNISKMMDGLEKMAWVKRIDNPSDGRSTHIELTEEGVRKADEMLPVSYGATADLWNGLNAREIDLLIHLLTKLRVHALTRSVTTDDIASHA